MNFEGGNQKKFDRVRSATFAAAMLQLASIEDARSQTNFDIAPNINITTEESQAVFKNLGLDETNNSLQTKEIVLQATNGKYIVQIDQTHFNSFNPESTPLKIASSQREVGATLEQILHTNPHVKICPEGLLDVAQFDDEIQYIKEFSETLQTLPDTTARYAYLQDWIKTNQNLFVGPYAQKYQMIASHVFKDMYGQESSPLILKHLDKLNPLGDSVIDAFGIIQKLYNSGIITTEGIMPCENEKLVEEISNAMLNGAVEGEYERIQEARENHITRTLNNHLHSSQANTKFVVLVLGASHDMLDNLLRENSKHDTGTGYIRIRTATTAEVIKDIEQEIKALNKEDEEE